MIDTYPQYDNIDIAQYETLFGFYTLGFIKQHRPDIDIVDIRLKNNSWDCWHSVANYDWLDARIQQGLAQGKKVAIVIEDEHVVFVPNQQLTTILNQYVDHPVYWVTTLDTLAQQVYVTKHKIKIKILELPWLMLNECLTYYRVADTAATATQSLDYNYVCLVGNTGSQEHYPYNHKISLVRELHNYQLSSQGQIVLSSMFPYDEDMLDYCKLNTPTEYYTTSDPNYPLYARQNNVNGVWISKNVENFLTIDSEYHTVPLAINPETTTEPFCSTEKSIWPILLGKLFLLYGRPGTMCWIQQFYDVDIRKFALIEYDTIVDDGERLSRMLTDNRVLIEHAATIHQSLKPELEQARWTLGRNLYAFFLQQLEQIN